MGRLKALSPDQRPRERLLRDGAEALAEDELLALVFGTGRGQDEDALELSARVIAALGGLGGLGAQHQKRLLRVTGIGPVKASRLLAALELSRRIAAAPAPERSLDDSALAARTRGQVPTGEVAILAVNEDDPGGAPITLSLGAQFGPQRPPGSVLTALLMQDNEACWSVVVVRAGGKPSPAEQVASERLLDAAELVGLTIERILVVNRTEHWRITRGVPE